MKQRARLSRRGGVIPLGWRVILLLPVTLSAISCERLPTAGDEAAPSRPSFSVVPGGGSWITKSSLANARTFSGAGVASGMLYAVGGANGAASVVATEAYDPLTDAWSLRAPLPAPQVQVAVGVVNNILYAVGGAPDGSFTGFLATVEAYDPVTNTWTSKAPMPTPRRAHAVGVVNGVLYAV